MITTGITPPVALMTIIIIVILQIISESRVLQLSVSQWFTILKTRDLPVPFFLVVAFINKKIEPMEVSTFGKH